MKEKNNKINVVWNSVGSIFYYFCQWITTIIVVRIGSYEMSGYYALAMTTSASFAAIANFSMRNYQISDIRNDFSNQEYIGSRILTCFSAQLLCMLVSISIVSNTEQWKVIALFMLLRLCEAFVDVLQGIEQKFDRFDLIGFSFILRGIVIVAGFSLGLYFTGSLLFALSVIVMINILIVIFFDVYHVRKIAKIKPVINKKVIKLLLICTPIVIFSFLLSSENTITKTVLEKMYGAELLGYYSSIASPTLIVQVGASVIFTPFIPELTELFFNGSDIHFKKSFHKIILYLLFLAIIVTIGALIVGKWGLNLIFGSEILEYYGLFIPIVWVTILTAFTWILSSIVISIRKIKGLLIGIVISFIICVASTYPMIKKFKANGISYVLIISLFIFVLYLYFLIQNAIHKNND